jgi:hypothetical protein
MVVTQKLYPRATVKRIVKAHAGRNISKHTDILVWFSFTPVLAMCILTNLCLKVFLDYMLFMQE